MPEPELVNLFVSYRMAGYRSALQQVSIWLNWPWFYIVLFIEVITAKAELSQCSILSVCLDLVHVATAFAADPVHSSTQVH